MSIFSTLRDRVVHVATDPKQRNVLLAGAGMVGLVAGRKVAGLALFGKGLRGLEQQWRADHPEFDGDFAARWQKAIEFYEATHQDDTNRKLHIIGIPMIVGGAAGLFISSPLRPLWWVAATSFTAGWVLNFVGHGMYEKKAPAFADDPLSFLAGPVWDFQQLFGIGAAPAPAAEPLDHEDINVDTGETAHA